MLAVVLDRDEAVVNRLVADKRRIDAEMALMLESVFGVPADRFLELQQKYDLLLARTVSRGTDPAMARRATLFGKLPVSEMIKRGWLSATDVRDPKVERELARFFGVTSPDEIEVLPHAAKKTDVFGAASPAQVAWLYRVRRIADEVLVPKYSLAKLRATIAEFRHLLNAAENARHVPKMLMECGVRYVIVETIGDAKIDGVCFWLKDGTSPVVGMTCRFDRIDNFWFVLRHELEHVLHEHGRAAVMLDADLVAESGDRVPVPEEERIANEAAAEFCVPQEKLRKFITVKAPLYSERDMVGFARTLRVHPGIVAGQLRHATGRYELFKKHLVKIRSAVTPTATVDGWGDVVPLAQ